MLRALFLATAIPVNGFLLYWFVWVWRRHGRGEAIRRAAKLIRLLEG